jgi:hypothetical protein
VERLVPGGLWELFQRVVPPAPSRPHRRFTEWTAARVRARPHRLVLDGLGSRGDLDWSRCAIDSVNMRALLTRWCGGADARVGK